MMDDVLWVVEVMPMYGNDWLPVYCHPRRCEALKEMAKQEARSRCVARVTPFFRGDAGVERVPEGAEAEL